MKVNHEISHALASNTQSTARAAASTGVKSAEQAPPVGSVRISEASRALVAGTSDAQPPFDVKRVEAIKSAISAGQFRVNPEAVADKVLDSASQLLSGRA